VALTWWKTDESKKREPGLIRLDLGLIGRGFVGRMATGEPSAWGISCRGQFKHNLYGTMQKDWGARASSPAAFGSAASGAALVCSDFSPKALAH
jgi:hypothetical protein